MKSIIWVFGSRSGHGQVKQGQISKKFIFDENNMIQDQTFAQESDGVFCFLFRGVDRTPKIAIDKINL